MATAFSIILSVFASGLSVYVYVESRRRDRRDIFLKVHHELLLSDDALRGRQILYDKVTDEASVEMLSDDDYRDAHRAIGMLNTLAYYMKKGYIDEEDVMGIWAEALYRACMAAEPLIQHRERRTGHRPFVHLEYLATGTRDYMIRGGGIPDFAVWRRPGTGDALRRAVLSHSASSPVMAPPDVRLRGRQLKVCIYGWIGGIYQDDWITYRAGRCPMGGLQVGTIALLVLWTAWTMLALVLMDRGKWLLGVFIPLGILLAIESDVTWRGYVMAWLGVHALVSVRFADEGHRAKQIALSIVSLGGVGWLWGADGWLYAGPVIMGAVIAAGAAAVALSCYGLWKFRKARGSWPLSWRARTVPARERLHAPGDRTGSRPRPGPGLVTPPTQTPAPLPDFVPGIQVERSRRSFEPLVRVPAGTVTREAGPQETGSDGAQDVEVYTAFAVRDLSAAEAAGDEPVFWEKRVYRIRKLAQEGEADRWYVVVEFARIAIAAPGEVRRAAEAVRDAFSAGEKSFVNASRGLFVSEITSDVFDGAFGGKGGVVVQWVTRDPMELGAIDTAINDASHWLHSVVAMPFRDAAGELGACPPGMVPLVGEIAAKMALVPLDRSIGKLTRDIAFIGVGVGLAFGLAPLAIACSKLLVHRELGRALDAGVRKLGRSLFGDPASREPEANVIQAHARASELPELSRERTAELTRPGAEREAREAGILTSQRVDAALRRGLGRTAESRARSRRAGVEREAAEEYSGRAVRERDAVSEPEIGWGR